MASFDEEVKKRARQARAQKASDKPNLRETTGNKPQAEAKARFNKFRGSVRSGARAAGRLGGAATAEVGGVAGEFAGGTVEGLGLKDKVTKIGTTGKEKITAGLKRARAAAGRLPGFRDKSSLSPKGKGGVNISGGVQNRVLSTGQKAARFGLRLAGPAVGVGLLANEARKPSLELQEQGGGQTINPLRGDPNPPGTPGGQAPVNLERPGDAFLAAGQSMLGTIRGAFGFGAEDSEATEQTPADPGLRVAAPPTGAPPAGAPPAGVRQAFTTGRGAEVPAPGTGFFGPPGGQRTNIGTPTAPPAPGLRAAAQPEQLEGTNRRTLDALSEGVDRGGIASAFGALATGGNVLRQEVAERQQGRQLQQQSQRQKALLDVALTNASADIAGLPLKEREAFQKNLGDVTKSIQDARTAGDQAEVDRQLDTAFRVAIDRPDSAQATIAGVEAASEISAKAGSSLLDALSLGTERGLIDFFSSLSQGGQPRVSLNPENTLFIDFEKGEVQQISNDGTTTETLVEFSDLERRTQDLLRSKGIIRKSADEEGRRVFQRGDPSARPFGLRQ